VSKNVAVFVDVANLYYSARGQEVDVDYVALLKAATKGRDLIRAYAYSGLDPENENQRKFIDFLGKNGYKVVHKDIRKFGDGRVKANLDIELVVDLFRLAKRMDIAVIVSGDGDFAPAIRALQDEGVRCEVISFRPNTSSDLIAVADEFIDIMKIASIGRGAKETKAEKGMSAPPMPAKEVVPEFGFREASPSVAAAALAAAREGRESRSGSRSRAGTSGRSRSKAAAEEPTAAAPSNGSGPADIATAAGDDSRRRRRRRGGRGRGRGRQAEGATATTETSGEIGWVELDDISQIDELDSAPLTDDTGQEREYTFEEADEATLAELGLLDGDAGTAAADQVAEVKPARRSSSRSRKSTKANADEVAADAPATPRKGRSRKTAATADEAPTGAAEKPAGRTRATKSATTKSATPKSASTSRATKDAAGSTDAAAADSGEAAAKPKRRRSTKSTSPQTESAASEASSDADGDGQPQGIWQRFRSARGGTAS